MVFKILLFEIFLPPLTTLITTTRSYPQLCDVSMLTLLSLKTSRFIGLTTCRYKVWFQGPTINNNKEVKVVVIFKNKLKLTRGLLVYLVVIIVLYKILNCLNFNFITGLLKNPKQLVNR